MTTPEERAAEVRATEILTVIRPAYDKWTAGQSVGSLSAWRGYHAAWTSRQPEIDALVAEIARLRAQRDAGRPIGWGEPSTSFGAGPTKMPRGGW